MATRQAATPTDEQRCQIWRTLDVVGDKWSLLIVRNAVRGQSTFSEFRDALGVPSDILTARLAKLTSHGILEKRAYRDAGGRQRFSYHLTEAGRGLKVVLAAMMQWGDEYIPSSAGAASVLRAPDDREVELAWLTSDGDRLAEDVVRVVPGPGATVGW